MIDSSSSSSESSSSDEVADDSLETVLRGATSRWEGSRNRGREGAASPANPTTPVVLEDSDGDTRSAKEEVFVPKPSLLSTSAVSGGHGQGRRIPLPVSGGPVS